MPIPKQKKNRYILPLAGVLVLVVLFIFQKQQTHLANALQAEGAVKSARSVALADPLSGTLKGRTIRCNAFPLQGVEYDLIGVPPAGSLEFDILAVPTDQSCLLFGIYDQKRGACALQENGLDDGFLCFLDSAAQRLSLRWNVAAVSFPLPAETVFPVRLLCEWGGGNISLYLNGIRAGILPVTSVLRPARYALFVGLGEPAAGSAKTANLKLVLP